MIVELLTVVGEADVVPAFVAQSVIALTMGRQLGMIPWVSWLFEQRHEAAAIEIADGRQGAEFIERREEINQAYEVSRRRL